MSSNPSRYPVTSASIARNVYVDQYGADPTGATDSTAAFIRAQTAGGTGPFNLVLGEGTYLLGTSQDIGSLGRGQGIIGQGSGVTTINYAGNATCINVTDSSFSSTFSMGGTIQGLTIDGTTSGASSVLVGIGNMNRMRGYDLNLQYGNVACLQFKNTNAATTWSEQGEWRATKLIGPTGGSGACVIFDSGSFDYSSYQFLLFAPAGVDGIRLQNGAVLEGCRMEVRGNIQAGTPNTAAVFALDRGNSSGTSRIDGTQWYISVECDGASGTGHQTILMGGGSSSQFNGTGVWQFRDGTVPFVAASVTGQNCWLQGVASMAGFNARQYSQWSPNEQSYKAWTFDPSIGNGLVQPVSGTLALYQVKIPYPANVAHIDFVVGGTAASGVTASVNFVGLYNSSGTLLASTATDSNFATPNAVNTVTITGQQLQPGLYWVAFLMTATTMPQLLRIGAQVAAATNANLGASTARAATGGAQTSLPSPLTPGSNTLISTLAWAGLRS